MRGSRPEQSPLTKGNDLSKTDETRAVIEGMVDGLNDHTIDGIGAFFHDSFRWMGNQGCGIKDGLQAFRNNWQLPLRAAFTERDYKTDRIICEGEWASCFGHIEATHSGPFMGIEAPGKRAKSRRSGRYARTWRNLRAIAHRFGAKRFRRRI